MALKEFISKETRGEFMRTELATNRFPNQHINHCNIKTYTFESIDILGIMAAEYESEGQFKMRMLRKENTPAPTKKRHSKCSLHE